MNYLDKINKLIKEEKFSEAQITFEKYYQNNPENPEIKEGLALIYGKLGKYRSIINILFDALTNKNLTTNSIYYYGLASLQLEDEINAFKAFETVIQKDSRHIEALKKIAYIHLDKNQLNHAEMYLKKAYLINEDDESTIEALIFIQKEFQNYKEALNYIDQLLKKNLKNYELLSDKSYYLALLKRDSEAISNANKSIKINPKYTPAWINLSNAYQEKKNYELALNAINMAIELDQNISIAWSNKSNTLISLKRYKEAIEAATKAIEIDNNNSSAYSNLGLCQMSISNNEEGIKSINKALEINPNLQKAWVHKASYYYKKNEYKDSLICCNKAIQLDQQMLEPLLVAANTYNELKNYTQAIRCLNRCLDMKPDDPEIHARILGINLAINNWEDYYTQVELLQKNIENNIYTNILPHTGISIFNNEEINFKITKIFTKNFELKKPNKYSYTKSEKIRIGYFSYDFRDHAVYHLIRGVFKNHNKDLFDIYCFKLNVKTSEEIKNELENNFTKIIEIANMSYYDVKTIVADHNIDIAIDLGGHTKDSALGIFSLGIAPIQINYLGYPGTTAVESIDYIIADKTLIPENNKKYYSEKIIYLKNSYQPNDFEKKISSSKTVRNDHALPNSKFIYCCFNNSYKINPETFDSWMNILKKATDSILWLLEDNEINSNNLKKEAEKRGVSSERIIFAKRIKLAQHLERQRHADLFLDTLPYNAHTTCSDALWAGLPVLTLLGNTFSSRVAASLLNAIEMPELVTYSREEYENLAVDLALNPNKLKALKQKLQDKICTTSLFDTQNYTKNLELAYQIVYQKYLDGESPDHIYL